MVANSNIPWTYFDKLPFYSSSFLLLPTFLGLAHLLEHDLMSPPQILVKE